MFSSLLVFCSTAVPVKNKFASIYGSAGFESFRCNGVRGVDECGYLCWRHWDAGQGSIRLAEPSHPCGQYAAAPLTLIHITLHLHNSTQSPRSGRARLFPFQFVQHETKWHMIQTLTDQMPGYISQHALIAGGLSATTAHIFLIQYLLPHSDSTQAQQAALFFVLRVVVSR